MECRETGCDEFHVDFTGEGVGGVFFDGRTDETGCFFDVGDFDLFGESTINGERVEGLYLIFAWASLRRIMDSS